jgi:hypothetical protein
MRFRSAQWASASAAESNTTAAASTHKPVMPCACRRVVA